jgi:hypothetical protein
MTIAGNDVRTTDHATDHASDYRAWRSCNHGTSTRADTDAFQGSCLGHDGRSQQQ